MSAYREPSKVRGIVIDYEADLPLYRQIANGLRALIARGQLAEGDTLPSVRKLGGLLGVNLNTVAKAYRILSDEGVVELRHGAPARVLALGGAGAIDEAAKRQLVDAVGKLKVRGASEQAVREIFDDAVNRFFEEG